MWSTSVDTYCLAVFDISEGDLVDMGWSDQTRVTWMEACYLNGDFLRYTLSVRVYVRVGGWGHDALLTNDVARSISLVHTSVRARI